LIQIQLHGRTDVGQVREHNEDSFVVVHIDDNERDIAKLRTHDQGEKGTLLVVCDGMGGAAAGEVASSMAVDAIAAMMISDAKFAPPEGVTDDDKQSLARKLREAARDANQRIFKEARENVARAGMGTTMTAALLWKKEALIAQVGDSRCYVWRQGRFTQVTRDQSLVNQLLESGHITPEQAKFFEHSNVILQALGVQDEVEVQLSRVSLRKGDRFMLCSDGLVGVVTDEEIGEIVGGVADPEEASRLLIEMANAAGGPDNITIIVAHVDGEELAAATEADQIKYELWRIEPEPPPLEITVEPSSQSFADEDTGESPAAEPLVPPAPAQATQPQGARRATLELVSMAVVVGLIAGSLATGMALYQQAVPCTLEAPTAGLQVVADGRSAGVSTVDGTGQNGGVAELRLRPGHHQLSLQGQGAPDEIQEVDVQKGGACNFKIPSAEPSK
jgi:serine/threonine protein phosphatase PrpC